LAQALTFGCYRDHLDLNKKGFAGAATPITERAGKFG
jgi:hypothetical protein